MWKWNAFRVSVDSLDWKTGQYTLMTPLGDDTFMVEMLSIEGNVVLKPGEDGRIRMLQLERFRKCVRESEATVTAFQFEYSMSLIS